MAFELGDIIVRLKADTSDLQRGFSEAATSGENLGNKLGSIFKTLAVGVAAAGTAVAAFGALSVKAYSEHEEQLAQLNQVLQTTGKVSGISSKEVEDLAMSLEHYSGQAHDSIIQGQVLLLQFDGITKKTLPEASKAMVDISQRMGIDNVAAAKLLGLVLTDPEKGFGRLRKAGIMFTTDQQNAIKAMEASGNTAGAVAKVMDTLNSKVGGAAGAYRNTLPGAISSAKQSLKDFEETVGGTIAKYLEPLATKAAQALSKIDWQSIVNKTIEAIKNFVKEIDNLWQWFDKIYQQVEKYLEPKLAKLWKTIEDAFPVFRKFIDQYINPLIEVLGAGIGVGLVWVIGAVIDVADWLLKNILTPLFKFMDDHRLVVENVALAFGALATSMALGAAFDALKVMIVTFQTITVPSLMTTLTMLGEAFWAAFPLAAIAAAAAIAFDLIIDGANKTKQAIDKLRRDAVNQSAAEDKAAKDITDKYHAGKLTYDQYTKAISATYGANTNNAQPQFAMGGFTGHGNPNDMAGIVHKGEYVLPQTAVNQSTGLPKNMGTTANIYGNINIDSPQDADYFFKRIDRNSLLESMGGSPL